MLKASGKSRDRRERIARLHAAVVARAREPVFFTAFGVADSLDGRFDLVALHAWLVLDALRRRELNDLSQGLTDALFIGFDEALRELGAGDMSLGRKMKNFADAFFGRLKAYGEARSEAELAEAILRNLYRGGPNLRILRFVGHTQEVHHALGALFTQQGAALARISVIGSGCG